MIEFIKERKKIIIIGVLAIILIIGYLFNTKNEYNEFDENEILVSEKNAIQDNKNDEEEEDMIVVHITGAVKTPGVVRIKENARIEDAIEAAGGLTEDANISNVNLAYAVEDGIKIRIPSIYDEDNEEESYITEDSGQNIIMEETNTSDKESNMVNLNTATQTELETLPGIGPSLAGRIVDYREQNGKFKNIEDIKNVSGIGDNKFNNIKDYITV